MNGVPDTRDKNKKGDIALFSTNTDVIAIESPIKGIILGIIAAGDISFDEIVVRTGKAKSTISVHINDLQKAGLISSRSDPSDRRKKILSLTGKPIGFLTNSDRAPAKKQIEEPLKSLPFTDGNIASFFRYMLRIIRTEAMNCGVNTDPILEKAGNRIGTVLLPLISDENLERKVQKMDSFWKKYELGTIALVNDNPITLKVHGCFECEDLPITGHGACSFDIGVLSAVFLKETKGNPSVVEIECYSSGYDHCTFVIKEKDENIKENDPGDGATPR